MGVVVIANTVLLAVALGQSPKHQSLLSLTSVRALRSFDCDHDVLRRRPARRSHRKTVVALVALTG
jgi:hypothetical protein